MKPLSTIAVLLLSAGVSAWAQDLPAKMQGKYRATSGREGGATIEMVSADGPDKARVRIKLTDNVTMHGSPCGFSTVETVAERKDGAWKLSFPSEYCKANWVISIKPVEGKQRFDGTFTTDSAPPGGTVYFEW